MNQTTTCTYSPNSAVWTMLSCVFLTWLLLLGYASIKRLFVEATNTEIAEAAADPPAAIHEPTAPADSTVRTEPARTDFEARATEALEKLDAYRGAWAAWSQKINELATSTAGRRIAAARKPLEQFAALKDGFQPDWTKLSGWELRIRGILNSAEKRVASSTDSDLQELSRYLETSAARAASLERRLTEVLKGVEGKQVPDSVPTLAVALERLRAGKPILDQASPRPGPSETASSEPAVVPEPKGDAKSQPSGSMSRARVIHGPASPRQVVVSEPCGPVPHVRVQRRGTWVNRRTGTIYRRQSAR